MLSDSDAGAQAKFGCFDQNLLTATGDLRSSLVARMKLLLQLSGERLTAAQRTRVEELYDSEPAAPACAAAITWDASCEPAADNAHVSTQLQLCTDLVSNPNTSQAVIGAELDHCTSQLGGLARLGDSCRTTMRDSADATVQTLLEKAQPSFAGDFSTALPLAFSRIGAWWSGASALAASDHSWFMGRSSGLARWLWSTIEAQRMPLPQQPPANDTQAATLLADISNTRLTNDLSILSYAFAPGQSNSAPPLLTMTADALQALSDRLERLEPVHDVGCRFKGCKDGTTLVSTATSELVRALATLPDGPAYTASLAAATHLHSQQPAIYTALTKIRDQHAYLETAWNLFGRPEPFSQLATIADPPFEAEGLTAIVRQAAMAWASYQGTGEFLAWNGHRLTASTLRQSDLVGFINGLATTAASERAAYMSSRFDTVRDLLDQSRTGAAGSSLADQLDELLDRERDIAGRIDGLEQREVTERAALGGFSAAFESLANSGALDPNATYQTHTIPAFSASAADSHYPNGGARNVVRDGFHVEQLSTGQSLRIHVTGQWSPSCAVANGNIANSDTGLPVPIVVREAQTGPEGYFVVAEDHRYASLAISKEGAGEFPGIIDSCASDSLSFSSCTFSNLVKPGDGVFASGTVGFDTRTSATFSSGLRLRTTPYPEAPAGSLVAVITRKGVTGAASDPPELDIRVVHRDDVIVATTPPPLAGWPDDGAIEVHFVVNDRATLPDGTPCPRPPASALQVELVNSTPLASVAQAVGAAMSTTLNAIDAAAPAVIAQGELSGNEVSALRSDAWVRVQQRLPNGIGLQGIPPELRQLFDSFIERQIASIARRAQRDALRRQLFQLSLQIDAIRSQQRFTADQDRLLHLIPRWRLRDLAGVKLATSASSVSEALTSYAAPIFELRDPSSLTNFRSQMATQAGNITDNLQITAPYEDTLDNLVSFARAAATAIGSAQFELPSAQRRTIIIAIPRPTGPGHAAWTGPWRTVSPPTAQAFWDSVTDAQNNLLSSAATASITLSPADVYTGPGGASNLSCMDLAPVVRHAGFYFATESRPAVLGPTGVEIVTTAATTSPVWFPLVGHTTSFEFNDPLGIPMRVRALNGNTIAVLGDGAGNANFSSWPADLDAGAGISPFTSFHLDMRVFGPQASPDIRDVLAHTTAMFMVFEVERRTANVLAWVPGVCAN
jgi:hypothetical protein